MPVVVMTIMDCFMSLGTVTRSMLDEEENVDAVRQLTEQFEEVK